jgi:hypothetical protein
MSIPAIRMIFFVKKLNRMAGAGTSRMTLLLRLLLRLLESENCC